MSKYKYKIDLAAGKTPSNLTWTSDKPDAQVTAGAAAGEADASFTNTSAAWITLRVEFDLDGKRECAEKKIALVKVEVGVGTFTNPGKVQVQNGTDDFQVNPPPPPATPTWVTTNDPGSDRAKFTTNVTKQAKEPATYYHTSGAGGGAAYQAVTNVKLTSPAEKPTAQQKIQVGFTQHGSDSGSATYNTTPAGGKRNVVAPTADTIDWSSQPPGPTDDWPWYDTTARDTGSGTGTWNKTFTLQDSPACSIPRQHDPNNAADPNATKPVTAGAAAFAFVIQIAARTMDADLGADKLYFEQSRSTWTVNYAFPATPGVSLVAVGAAWAAPANPTLVSVNVIPTSMNHNSPFMRWNP